MSNVQFSRNPIPSVFRTAFRAMILSNRGKVKEIYRDMKIIIE